MIWCLGSNAAMRFFNSDKGVFTASPGDIYTAPTENSIEALNYSLRKIIRGRGAFPHDDAIRKLLYPGLRNVSKKWTLPIRDRKAALNQFLILMETGRRSDMNRPVTQLFLYPQAWSAINFGRSDSLIKTGTTDPKRQFPKCLVCDPKPRERGSTNNQTGLWW